MKVRDCGACAKLVQRTAGRIVSQVERIEGKIRIICAQRELARN
jgi:hypothetical protein